MIVVYAQAEAQGTRQILIRTVLAIVLGKRSLMIVMYALEQIQVMPQTLTRTVLKNVLVVRL